MTSTARSALRGLLRLGAMLSVTLGLLSAGPAQPVLGDNGAWSFNWAGQAPAAPTPWHPTNWSVAVHSRDISTLDRLEPMAAQHGADCGPPPATHTITNYQDAVFLCKEHMMTAINASGYGAIYLTPDHTMNFDGGTSSLTFSVSTVRTSQRDWWDLWVTPWQENLVLPLQTGMPDLSGPPKDSLHIMMVGENRFTAELYRGCVPGNCNSIDLPVASGDTWDSRVPPSARIRTTFQLDVSQNHVRFGIPSVNLWWVDTNVSLPFSQGILQVGHHSYTPTKDAGCGPPPGQTSCEPDTWHWSDFAISRTGTFGILNGDLMSAHAGAETVHFPAPAPAGSFLRFSGLGLDSLRVSYSGGAPVAPQRQVQAGRQGSGVSDPSEYVNYWTPVPEGTTSVRFSGQDWWGGPWWAEGIAIWSGTPVNVTGSGQGTGTGTGTGTGAGAGTGTGAGGAKPPVQPQPAPDMSDHQLKPGTSQAAATASNQSPLPRPGSFGALVARVPYGRVTLPLGGLVALLALGFGGLLGFRQLYDRRRRRPGLPRS